MSGSESDGIEGPVRQDGLLYFSRLDLVRYELAQFKVANALQTVQLKEREIEAFQRNANERMRSMHVQLEQCKAHARRTSDELVTMQEAIARRYEVELSVITYDDQTGRITIQEVSDG